MVLVEARRTRLYEREVDVVDGKGEGAGVVDKVVGNEDGEKTEARKWLTL